MRMPPAPTRMLLCLVLCLAALPGCVVGVQLPLTQAEASAGPPPAEPERVPDSEPRAVASDAAATRATEWVRGYWHYDGLRYSWVPGRWQESAPRFSWSER